METAGSGTITLQQRYIMKGSERLKSLCPGVVSVCGRGETVNYILLIIIGFVMALYFVIPCVSVVYDDENYYIAVARDIAAGAVPTVTVSTAYTPLVFYIFALFFKLFGYSSIAPALIVSFFQICNVVVLNFIWIKYLNVNRRLSLFMSLLALMAIIKTSGLNVVLEPIQIFFVLCAFLIIGGNDLNLWRSVTSGFLIGLSIMCKQYSVLFVFPLFFWFIRSGIELKNVKKYFLYFSISCVAVVVPFLLFVLFTKATLIGSLRSFGFIGDVATSYAMGESGWSIFIIHGLEKYIRAFLISPFLLMPIILYPLIRMSGCYDKSRVLMYDNIFVFALCSSAVLFVTRLANYYLIPLPWTVSLWYIILSSLGLRLGNEDRVRRKIFYLIFTACTAILLIGFAYKVCTKVVFAPRRLIRENSECAMALKAFPYGSEVFVEGNERFNVLCNYSSPVGSYNFLNYWKLKKEGGIPGDIRNVIVKRDNTAFAEYLEQNGFLEVVVDRCADEFSYIGEAERFAYRFFKRDNPDMKSSETDNNYNPPADVMKDRRESAHYTPVPEKLNKYFLKR